MKDFVLEKSDNFQKICLKNIFLPESGNVGSYRIYNDFHLKQ